MQHCHSSSIELMSPAAPLSETAKLQHSTAVNKWQGRHEPHNNKSAALHPVPHTSDST